MKQTRTELQDETVSQFPFSLSVTFGFRHDLRRLVYRQGLTFGPQGRFSFCIDGFSMTTPVPGVSVGIYFEVCIMIL